MKCPRCKNGRLEACEPEAGLGAQLCSACRGMFVAFEAYFRWQSGRGEAEAAARCDDAPASAGEAVSESGGGKLCPGCGRFMSRLRVSLDVPFMVDRCGGCAGMWFDEGEWAQLKSRGMHGRLHLLFAEWWQHKMKEEERKRQHEERYRSLLGADFYAKARDFKQWLDVHPQRGVVLAYLAGTGQE